MNPSESDAIDAFERLGLTSYESKVFIALQRLGSGTARDVAEEADVPRSQVYSVADSLADRGLLEVQQSNPIRYRPVTVEEAQNTLRDRFETEQERAFEYVEAVREKAARTEEREDIWTVRGRSHVDDRVVGLLESAEERVIFGTRLSTLLTHEIERVLEERVDAGVDVTTISASDEVRKRLEKLEGVTALPPMDHRQDDDISGRIVIVDDDGILLSVVDDDGTETAIWSSGSLFASVLIQLIEASDEAP